MKGVKVYRAQPSNAIDIYALLKEAAKEKVLPENPSEKLIEKYYFTSLMNELCDVRHLWFLARRGRGFLGYLHAIIVPGRWDGSATIIIDFVYVTKNRRKNGIGKKLLDELVKSAENMGVKRLDFMCPVDQTEYWQKERGAIRKQDFMRVDL